MKYVIITRRRRSSSNCKFCGKLAGVYRFDLTEENWGKIKRLYSRHSNCRCVITRQIFTDKSFSRLSTQRLKVIDYTREVLKNATPGKGKIEYLPAEVVKKMNKNQLDVYETDKACAEWLHRKFGGNIKIIQPTAKAKSSDFLWKEEMWELKTFKGGKIARIDDKLRAGVRQSRNRAVIINITKESRVYNNLDLRAIKRLVDKRKVKQLIIKRSDELLAYFVLI